MKKKVLLILTFLLPVLLFTSCGSHQHDFKLDEKLDWYHTYVCKCGEIKKEDHIYDVLEVIEEATVSNPGKYKVECTVCDYVTTIEQGLAHICDFSNVYFNHNLIISY